MKIKKTFFLLFVLLLIILAFFTYRIYIEGEGISRDGVVTSITPPIEQVNEGNLDIPSGWLEYESDVLDIELDYPPEMDVSENEDGTVRFLIIGPSQAMGTEVYDGIILTLYKGTYINSDLASYVESIVEEKKNDPIYEQLTQTETIEVGNISGYKFIESALGTFTNIYLPAGEGTYLLISYLLEDPTDQGFSETLDLILKSLTLK